MGDSSYLQQCILKNTEINTDPQQVMLATSGHFLCTKVAYALGLTGPCINMSTACSTALVAIATACQSLIDYDCDMAMAGGITIIVPQQSGYLYQESGILSPDGHCRPFDKSAQGTVISNGCGIVVLRRLQDALTAKDNIMAIVKGWAINNDGADKVGFTAPSVNGQAACVAQAVAYADIDPTEIDYIEAHGTGTLLGDPIEIAALTKGYNYFAHKHAQYCAVGSVKANIGHTDIAAGVAGFIKTVLALKEKILPPTLYCDDLNEQIHFTESPFYVNQSPKIWEPNGDKRTAAVNSLGFGGTNAHVILQEAPEVISGPSKSSHILVISAQTHTALEANTIQLESTLRNVSQELEVNPYLADVSYTLQIGRKHFKWRRAFTYTHRDELLHKLSHREDFDKYTHHIETRDSDSRIVFGFTGQGTQYVNMALELYKEQPVFRRAIEACCDLLERQAGYDLRRWLFPQESDLTLAHEKLNDTRYAQPALFIIEYALAKFLIDLGIKPQAIIGHSLGEYVAAVIAESLELVDALFLVITRAHLMARTQPGAMLIVPLRIEELVPLLEEPLALAAHNSPELSVVLGSKDEIENFEKRLKPLLQARDLTVRYLNTTYGFHSSLMDEILDDFFQKTSTIRWRAPQIPYISNLTGRWVTEEDFRHRDYWRNHIRQTVRFSEGISELALTERDIFIELGPGRTLMSLVRQHQKNKSPFILGTLPGFKETSQIKSYPYFLNTLTQLWLRGKFIEWKNLYTDEIRKRVSLPTYSFDKKSYWIHPTHQDRPVSQLYSVSWERSEKLSTLNSEVSSSIQEDSWLIFAEKNPVCENLINQLVAENKKVYTVFAGEKFERLNKNVFRLCSSG